MSVCIDKHLIEKNFSRCAKFYDDYAEIQRTAALELIKELPKDGINDILELGCGTGNYTRLLRERFENARIRAVDISKEMIDVASKKLYGEEIEFIISDAEVINISRKFGLITSNAAFQWFNDIEKTITRYSNTLMDKGEIVFSVFGPLTFRELSATLKKVLTRPAPICAENFLCHERLETILENSFSVWSVREEIIKRSYPSFIELLKRIRYTGSRGYGMGQDFSWKKETLKKVEEVYNFLFGRIEATYQIIFCKGIK